MQYRREVFVEQVPLVDKFVKHLIHHRALRPWIAPTKTHLATSFWSDTSDAHLFQAIINWCKVFGSDSLNQTHWKALSPSDAKALRATFRDDLFASTSMDATEWDAYQTEVTSFRNSYAAHRDLGFSQPVPLLDRALEVALHYDKWIRKVIAPDQLDELPLGKVVEDLREKVETEVRMVMLPYAKTDSKVAR
jgi:hypothetical protein